MEGGNRRKRQEWEAQYVADYVARRYPKVPVKLHARLGTPPMPLSGEDLTEEEQRMLRVRMRWADAIVFLPNETIVIEGKLRASEFLKAIGELELYVSLLPHTPEHADLMADRIVGELLIPIEDQTVEALARRKGFRVVVYSPPWLSDYMSVLQARFRRPIRPEEAVLL